MEEEELGDSTDGAVENDGNAFLPNQTSQKRKNFNEREKIAAKFQIWMSLKDSGFYHEYSKAMKKDGVEEEGDEVVVVVMVMVVVVEEGT